MLVIDFPFNGGIGREVWGGLEITGALALLVVSLPLQAVRPTVTKRTRANVRYALACRDKTTEPADCHKHIAALQTPGFSLSTS